VLLFLVFLLLRRLLRVFVGNSSVAALEVENAVLRHQLAVLRRSVKRPLLWRVTDCSLPLRADCCHGVAARCSWFRRRRFCAGTVSWCGGSGVTGVAVPVGRRSIPRYATWWFVSDGRTRAGGASRIRGELPKLGIRVGATTCGVSEGGERSQRERGPGASVSSQCKCCGRRERGKTCGHTDQRAPERAWPPHGLCFHGHWGECPSAHRATPVRKGSSGVTRADTTLPLHR
jgi:hypothetical protein